MATFFAIIGVIALFILGKFIYDTYLTNNTTRRWNVYKRNHPEDAAKVERNGGLSFNNKSQKTKENEKIETLNRLANNMDCLPNEVKEKFLAELNAEKTRPEECENLIKIFKEEKYKESQTFGIDIDNTIPAFFEKWTNEYLENKDYADRERTFDDVTTDLLYENPTLNKISKTGDINMITNYLDENNDVSMSFLRDMVYSDRPAENYRQKAIDKMYRGKDGFLVAIRLINKGLSLNELKTEPFLLSLRADCQFELGNFEEALNDMNKAIKSLNENRPETNFLSDFHLDRAKIKEEIGDLIGAELDREIAQKYNPKLENTEQQCRNSSILEKPISTNTKRLVKTDLEKFKLFENVKSIRESSYTVDRKTNEIVTGKIKDENFGKKGMSVLFNKKGYKLTEIIFDPYLERNERCFYHYDQVENIVEEKVYFDVNLIRHVTYKYDNIGDKNRLLSKQSKGSNSYIWKYKYNKGGRCIEIIHNSLEGKSHGKTTIRHNRKGQKIEEISYYESGIPYIENTFEYNKDGYSQERKEYLPDGCIELYVTSKYDNKGNLKYKEDYDNSTSFYYDEIGNVLQVININSLEHSIIHYSYEFDNKGNWIVKNEFSQIIEDSPYPCNVYIDSDYTIITKREIKYY